MKAILIARVSTEEQKEAGNSLPAQVARLERYCQNKGFEIIQTCSFDESAYKEERTEFDRILDFVIEQKEKIAVCCDKVDRLSRNVFDRRVSVLYERALKDELELHFISDGQIINSQISAVEKFQFSISLGLAKYYSDAVSDNVKRAIEQKLRKGEFPGRAPYGYINITKPDGNTDIIGDEYAARIVRLAFELYATGAYSLDLLRAKIKNEHGIDWSHSYIDKVLNNPFYYGSMLLKGELYPHRYPPIISKTLYDQVKAVKSSYNKKRSKFVGPLPFLYRGIFKCAQCGLSITPEIHKKKFKYYHCTEYKGKHGAKWLREEEITEALAKVFKSLQMPKEIALQIIDTLEEVHKNKAEFHAKRFTDLTKEQISIAKMMDNLYLDKLKGRITESEYDKFYTQFRDQVEDVTSKLAQLQEAEDNYYVTTKCLLEVSSRAYDLFMSSEVEEKRQLIKLVLSNLQVDDGKIVYDVQKPFNLIVNCSDDQVWRPQGDLNPCFRRERAMS